jgi:cellulose synthase/poly-beta-1,6-N-acetylglucosamine synthase-like glycosyltransferase
MGVATLDYIRKLYVDEAPLKDLPPIEPEPVALCTPVYNAIQFLDTYLAHVLMYDWPRDLFSMNFAVSGDDGTYQALKEFAATYGDDYRRIKVKRVKQVLGGEMPHVRNVVQARNLMIGWSKPDMVFFNDADNFNPPVSIKRLYNGLRLGASGAAGIYTFRQFDDDGKERIGFTSFFLHDQVMRHFSMPGRTGEFPLEMFGRRLWMDAVSCGCFLVKRELLDEQRFFFPTGTTMTDDTAFCLKARERGHRFIGDFGLMVHHWGYNVAHQEVMKIAVELDPVMEARRTLNREKGVYVHPKVDGNISAAVRKLIDIDKIKQIVDTHK